MVQHILVAHDLSAEADLALGRAAQLAQQTGATLSVLHVLKGDADEQHARARLRSASERYAPGLQHLWIRQGRPVEEIITQTAGLEADLLVVGRHHRLSAQGFAGTTLEQILQSCPAPLLLAVEPAAPHSRALAALDYSGCASRALQAAWKLLTANGELTALNIHEVSELQQPEPSDLTLQQELFDQLVCDLRADLHDSDDRLHARLRYGERINCLDSAIAELQPQLLALGSHSRGEISDTLLGSLTQQYLDQPPCDILIAR